MAGDAHVDESQFKGMSKYFNGVTMRGRANVSFLAMIKAKKALYIDQFTIIYHWIMQTLLLNQNYRLMFCKNSQVALATYGVIGAIIAYNMRKPAKADAKPAHWDTVLSIIDM